MPAGFIITWNGYKSMSNTHSLRPQEVSMKASLGGPFKPFPVKVLCVMQIITSLVSCLFSWLKFKNEKDRMFEWVA